MSDLVTIHRAGPHAGTLVRQVAVRGRPATLAILVEVWGAAERDLALAHRLAVGIAGRFERSEGSSTARLRAALAAADAWLRAQSGAAGADLTPSPTPIPTGLDGEPAGAGPRLAAGASVALLVGDEATLAQSGPSLAYADYPDALVRHPAQSPWLEPGELVLADHPVWRPLGMGREVVVNWAQWTLPEGAGILLADSRTAGRLTLESAATLIHSPGNEFVRLVRAKLPSDLAVLRLDRPEQVAPTPAWPTPIGASISPAGKGGQEARPSPDSLSEPGAFGSPRTTESNPDRSRLPSAVGADSGAWAGTTDVAVHQSGLATTNDDLDFDGGHQPTPDLDLDAQRHGHAETGLPFPDLETLTDTISGGLNAGLAWVIGLDLPAVGARAALTLRHILLGLLPSRHGEAGEDYRLERAQVALAVAVALPLLVLTLVAWMAWRNQAGAPGG